MSNRDKFSRRTALPEGHLSMVQKIRRLPPSQIPLSNWHQSQQLKYLQAKWSWIGHRIDYLERKQHGYYDPENLPDPARELDLTDPFPAKDITVLSDFYFSLLQLLIGDSRSNNGYGAGFSLVKESAIAHGRDFPFKTPRELFVQICEDFSTYSEEDLVPRGLLVKALRQQAAFLRERLEEEERTKILDSYREGDWSVFWIVGIFDYRSKQPLRESWKRFLKAHKALVSFHAIKGPVGKTISVNPVCDERGRWSDPKTRRLIEWNSS